MLVALIDAIPTYWDKYQSWRLNVEKGKSSWAIKQNALWRKNMECSMSPFEWVQTSDKTLGDTTICHAGGDIFVRFQLPQGGQALAFVSKEELTAEVVRDSSAVKVGLADLLMSSAHAQSSSGGSSGGSGAGRVLCQRWLNDGRLMRRISNAQGCFNQFVNTYCGVVEQQTPAHSATSNAEKGHSDASCALADVLVSCRPDRRVRRRREPAAADEKKGAGHQGQERQGEGQCREAGASGGELGN